MAEPYYARGRIVWQRPAEIQNPDGTRNIKMGFPVATLHEIMPDDAADTVAKLMNAGHAALNPEDKHDYTD